MSYEVRRSSGGSAYYRGSADTYTEAQRKLVAAVAREVDAGIVRDGRDLQLRVSRNTCRVHCARSGRLLCVYSLHDVRPHFEVVP